ncbi:MAG TPA: LPS assembly protein LptD [Terriglobales bacterium]|nr:LPS assembly protein LptD [Terriglobales bacterium]
MTLRTRFLITALFLCHQLPGSGLVTRELLGEDSGQKTVSAAQKTAKKTDAAAEPSTPCARQAATQDSELTTICALQQEKIGDIYKLHGDAEIHYHGYTLRAEEVTYNSDTGEATGTGHFSLDGGPNDDHIRASHGTYNLTAETGRFYDVDGTTGWHQKGNRVLLTSSTPFAFSGKMVEKTSPDHYLVYDGTITTCQLPHPDWQFAAHKIKVEVGANASLTNSSFWLLRLPVFYFPYATVPIDREARQTGFLIPTGGESSVKGSIIGDGFFWAINRSTDGMVGAEYYSKRGWSQRGEFRARPSDTSYVDLNYFGVIDRGFLTTGSSGEPVVLKEGGQEARLNAEGNFLGFRAVSNIDYLSSFLFRLAFSEIFTQATNSEVKSQVFLTRANNGFFLSGMTERYQDYFQLSNNGVLTYPPIFDAVQIWHTPSVDASSVDRPLWHSPFLWSFDASVAGLSRSEPGFHTGDLLGRFTFSPEISLPLQFHGWSLRPGLALHEGYYTERFVNNQAVNDPTNRQALDASVEIRPPALEKVFDKDFLGRKWKHVIEPRAVYRLVTGVNDFANVLHFDERDILSNTHEVEYGFVTRLYAKRPPSSTKECQTPMTGLAVGAAAPEQGVPWQHINTLENQSCVPLPDVREVATWELEQKYFLDPTFGGALVPGERNVFTTTEDLTGIAFATEPRHLSPLISRLRVATSSRTDTEWDLDYDFQLGRINASTFLVNYNLGPFTLGAGDAFLQIPQTSTLSSIPPEGTCNPVTTTTTQVTCKFQQFRVALGYGGLNRKGLSAATSFGYDSEVGQLQFATAQATYNWDCCGMTLEYRRYDVGDVRDENLFRFSFTLANIGSFGNLKKYERLY